MTDTPPTVEGLTALVSEYGKSSWNEGCADTAFDRLESRRHRSDAMEAYAAIEAYARCLSGASAQDAQDLTRAAAYLSPKSDADAVLDTVEAERIAATLRRIAAQGKTP
jgi:hypothetical protein